MTKSVPLLKISKNSSIYFDFEKNVPYIQKFKGFLTEEEGYSYSKMDTFFGGYVVMGGIAILGKVLDIFFQFPVILSIVFAVVIGISVGKIIVRVIVNGSFEYREYEKISLIEIKKAVNNNKNLWILRLTKWLMYLLIIVVIFSQLSEVTMSGKEFVLIIGLFGITVFIENSIHPSKALRAIKILKKQLKEGKYNE
ncbi:hypothetical protein [Lactovum odontotermitis]